MYFYLIGIDYKSAPLHIRENSYCRRQEIIDFWQGALFRGAAVLATCNRLEIYAVADNFLEALHVLKDFRKSFPDFCASSYTRYGERDVFRHALRLACGLESQLHGELQISDQLQRWFMQPSFPDALKKFWNKVMPLAEEIRTQYGLVDETVNIATVILDDIQKHHSVQGLLEIVVVGTGKIAELFSRHTIANARFTFVAHKHFERARLLARLAHGKAVSFDHLRSLLERADILVSATSSPHYVVRKDHFREVKRDLKEPLSIYDLALPRDVEPVIGILKGVILHNAENLGIIFENKNQGIREQVARAAYRIEEVLQKQREDVCIVG